MEGHSFDEENAADHENWKRGHHHKAELPAFEEGEEYCCNAGDDSSDKKTYFLSSSGLNGSDASGYSCYDLMRIVLIEPSDLLFQQ